MDWVMDWVLLLASKHPQVMAILVLIGTFRVIFKPLTTLIQTYVDATDTPADNAWWMKLQASPAFKAVLWVLDYTASIKLPKKP